MYLSAILLGLGGSLHCVGMCGPLVMAVPATPTPWLGRFAYHGGRIFTYATMGAIMGGLGQLIALNTGQQYMSVVMGAIMLLVILLPIAFRNKLAAHNPLLKINYQFRKWFGDWFKKRSYTAVMVLGMLNGLLVCGLVYTALATATATGSAIEGAIVMALFGLSTMPMLLGIVELGTFLPTKWFKKFKNVSSTVTFIVALLLIWRGLNLGLPLSPYIGESTPDKVMCPH